MRVHVHCLSSGCVESLGLSLMRIAKICARYIICTDAAECWMLAAVWCNAAFQLHDYFPINQLMARM